MILITPDGRQNGLQLGENLVGRSSDCVVRLDSPRASRHHAKIDWDGARARVMDLGSTNGTTLNGSRIAPNRYYPLQEGDQVDFGSGPCTAVAGLASGAFASAFRSGSSAPLPSVPPIESLPLPPIGYEEPPQRRFSWPLIAGLAAVLVIVFGLAIWWGLSRTKTEEATVKVAPTSEQVTVVEATSTSRPANATATIAVAKGAASANQPVAKAQAPAAAGMGAMPPINAQTMPALMQQFLGAVDPALISAMLGGTPIPGLEGLLGGSPVAPAAKRYPTPKLRAPANGSSYQGEDAVIILEWEPVQSLAANDYYWVMVLYKRGEREEAGGVWIKGTSYRVPAWFLTQAQGRFEWQVVMAEATGLAEQGGKLRGKVSDPSERRWFTWQSGGQPPAPNPGDSPIATPTYGG